MDKYPIGYCALEGYQRATLIFKIIKSDRAFLVVSQK
jgi:hypothetical protein